MAQSVLSRVCTLFKRVETSQFANRLTCGFSVFLFVFLLQVVVTGKYVYQLDHEETTTIVSQGLFKVVLKGVLHAYFWATLVWVGYSLIQHRGLKRVYLVLVLILTSAVYIVEALILKSYNMVFNNVTASIILTSNPKEASAFQQTVLKWDYLLQPVLTFLSILIFSIVVTVLLRRVISFKSIVSKVSVLLAPVGLVLGCVYTLPQTYFTVKNKNYLYELYAPIERFYAGTIEYLEEVKSMEQSLHLLRADVERDVIVNDNSISTPHTLVLIIGESLGRMFMHSYGYPLENTPNIDKRIASGDVIAFSNVISAAPNTAASIVASFTLHTAEERSTMWYERPSLTSVLGEAGYWTYWLSNTERYGGVTLPTTTLSMLADESLFTTVQSSRNFYNRVQNDHDELALPHLKRSNAQPLSDNKSKRNLLQVLHLMGSHHTYSDRYPKEFDVFKGKDVPVKRSPEKDLVVAQYSNSVLYNDHVIEQVFKYYEQEDAIVVYFSDHSQALYELPNNPDKFDHDLSEIGLSVPFLVYLSPSMRSKYPELYNKVIKAKDRRIMLDLLAHSICELVGIRTKYSDPKKEFFSDGYDDKRPRVASGYGQSIVL